MLGGSARTLLLGVAALFWTLAPGAALAGHHHGSRHVARYYGGYPGGYFFYGPGYAPGPGLAFGVAHYPIGVGFSVPFGPRDPRGSIRTLVEPRDAEVFIDGYFVGVVDDFDGTLQGLRLEPGPHTVTLYREGFRLHEETVYSTPGATVKIRHEMVPLAPGEAPPARPSPGAPAPAPAPSVSSAPSRPAAAAVTASDEGTLVLRISPPDAEIWIDGERWDFPPGSDRFVVHLPAGAHAIELMKEGFDGYAAEVEIRAGEASTVNVLLGAPLPP